MVIYQESTSDSEVQNLTKLKRAVKWESLKVGKSAVGKFATQNTLIPTFRTFHRQKYVGLKLPNIRRVGDCGETVRALLGIIPILTVAG